MYYLSYYLFITHSYQIKTHVVYHRHGVIVKRWENIKGGFAGLLGDTRYPGNPTNISLVDTINERNRVWFTNDKTLFAAVISTFYRVCIFFLFWRYTIIGSIEVVMCRCGSRSRSDNILYHVRDCLHDLTHSGCNEAPDHVGVLNKWMPWYKTSNQQL